MEKSSMASARRSGVSIGPGATTLTRMESLATSLDSALVSLLVVSALKLRVRMWDSPVDGVLYGGRVSMKSTK